MKLTASRQIEELAALRSSLEAQHEQQLVAMRLDWKEKLDTASSDASLTMKSLQSAAADELAQAQQSHASEISRKDTHHKQEVQDLLQHHEQELVGAKAGHDAALKGLRQDLDRTVWEKDKELAAVKEKSSKDLRAGQVRWPIQELGSMLMVLGMLLHADEHCRKTTVPCSVHMTEFEMAN